MCVPVCRFTLLLPLLSSSDVSSSSSSIWTLVATVETTSLFSSCPQWRFQDKMMDCFFFSVWCDFVCWITALPSRPVWPLVCCCVGKLCCGSLLWLKHCLHTAGPHLLTSGHPNTQDITVLFYKQLVQQSTWLVASFQPWSLILPNHKYIQCLNFKKW